MYSNAPTLLADPFWGTGGTQSIPFKDLGRGWNWLKALTGNTNPGAKRPLGWVSACTYSGAYSSGYGRFGCSGEGPAPELFDRQCAWGVTHFHPTGTGYLGFFYNYFLFTPWTDGANLDHISQLNDEIAHPGIPLVHLSSGIRIQRGVLPDPLDDSGSSGTGRRAGILSEGYPTGTLSYP